MFRREPKLHPEIVRDVENASLVADMANKYYPDADFIRVIKAGYLLRKAQHENVGDLANKPLRERPNETTMASIFRGIVNQSLDTTPREQGYASRLRRRSESICSAAEVALGHLINDTATGLQPGKSGGRVVLDEHGPLLLQKDVGEPTFLSLQPMTISGIDYPAGSIMGVHLRCDKNPNTGRYQPPVPHDGWIEATGADQIDGANFLRPSLLALTTDERRDYLSRPEWGFQWNNHPEALTAIAQVSVAQVADIVTSSDSLYHQPAIQ